MAKDVLRTLLCLVMILFLVKSGTKSLASTNNILGNNDESSLLALRDHGITTNTMLSENWIQETPFCSWIGVTCSRRHPLRVTALDLSSLGLEGTIPEEIGNLSFLSYLNIRNNSFTGPIPDTIGNLVRLRVLIMSLNKLSGEIPPTIGRLRKLESLVLSVNQLEGIIPNSIFNISSLLRIYLGGNKLSGTLPDLDIGYNLPQLQGLDLSGNYLTGTIPMSFWNLYRLQMLDLDRNQLTGTIPTSLGNLSKLEELDFKVNNIHGKVPVEIGQLSNLNVLSLGQNKLNGDIPASLYNMSNLQVISIPANEMYGEILSSISINLPNLELLYIGVNEFSGVIPSSISNLSALIELDMTNNSFSGLIPVDLGNLPSLQLVSLSANRFENNLSIPEQDFLTPLAKCKYLKWTDFTANPTIIGELPKSFFNSENLFAILSGFSAASCGISGAIPAEISNLKSLIWLDLSYNKLVGVIPESFGTLKKLQRVRLDDNFLQGLIPHGICNMTSLYYLKLSRNNLSGPLPLCLGTDLPLLQEIYLSENSFNSNIPFTLWSNSAIQKIHLNNNFFDGILSQEVGNLKSLIELNIYGNQLSGNISESVGQLQNLIILSISNNRLNGPIPDSLSDLKNLESLDLSHNDLSGPIPKSLASLSYLEYFNVSFNHLSGEIPNEGSFRNFTADCFIGNKDLCGDIRFKVKPCESDKPNTSHEIRLVSRFILPPVLLFLVFVVAMIFYIVTKWHRKSSNASRPIYDLPPGLSHERISYYDILQATRNFDVGSLIGRGSSGSVYKGEFSQEVIAAVKVFNLETQGALRSFDTECQILRSIRHRNLVKVITSCSNLDFKALVMEYMRNGNLDRWLHSTEYSLSISQRFGIMVYVAAALEYLHHGYSSPIIHCDLKPSNILLDNDMVAHVGDFGIAKLLTGQETTQQTKTLGTIGYMAPEYGSGGFISTAVDFYSYGIVLIEMFTKKKPTHEMFSEELTMRKWISESLSDSLTGILDIELLRTNEEDARGKYERCLRLVIDLALKCTSEVSEVGLCKP